MFLTIDLGSNFIITGVTVWHFYGDGRAYCSQKIATSTTGYFGGEECVAIDSGSDLGPSESADGISYTFPAHTARYVRHWCGRSTANSAVRFTEIDVYGVGQELAPPPPPSTPDVWKYVGCFRDNEGGRLFPTNPVPAGQVPRDAAATCA